MNLVVRRRLAASALLATSALVGSALLAPSSNAAAGGVSVTPSSAVNTEAAASLTFHTTDADLECGGTATFTRVGGGQPFSVTIDGTDMGTGIGTGVSKTGTGSANLADQGTGVGKDGPADAGTYNISVVGGDCLPISPNPGG